MKQLTGRANYGKYWVYRSWLDADTFKSKWWGPARIADAPKIPDPERLSIDFYNAIDAGGWYWEAGSKAADFCTINKFITTDEIGQKTVFSVSKAINGLGKNGEPNGLAERLSQTLRISKLLMDNVKT